MGYSWGLGMLKSFWGSSHIAEQLLSSLLPTILTFDLGSFLAAPGSNGLFLGLGVRFKSISE